MAATMDESVEETTVEVENLKEKRVEKGVLGWFGKLAEAKDDIREKAVVKIVQKLAQKSSKEDETNSELDYCLERLVRGLASSRQAARLGFYVALVEILRRFKAVKPSQVTGLISKHLFNPQEGKQEINPLIAMAFAYGALIRSERISEDPQSLRHVCEELLKLLSMKDFLQELCGTFLVEVFEKVEASFFSKCAWPALRSHFTDGWSSCTPDTLWMMLVLSEKQKNAVDETFLSKYWLGKRLLATKNFPRIAEICLSSTKSNPRIHPLCKHVLAVLSDTEHFAVFWKTLIEAATEKQQKEKQYLLFELLKESLERHLTTAERVKQLFLPAVVQIFVTNLAHREMLLHQAAVQMSKTVTRTAVRAQDGATQFEILKCLLTHPGTVMFDQVTKSTMIASIIPHLKPEAVEMLISLLRSIFGCSSSKTNSKAKSVAKPAESEAHRAAALRMITQLTGQSAARQDEAQKDALQYFAFHAFFDQLGRSKDIPQCSGEPVAVCQSLHDVSRDCFYRLLSVAPKRLTAGHNSSLLQHHCDVLNDVLKFVNLLLKNPEVATLSAPLGKEAREAFLEILKKAKSVRKRAKHEGHSSKAQAFQVLYLNLALQLFVDEKHTLSILQDLYVCCDRAFPKKDNAEEDDGEPRWIEVVVDLLLSLLSKNSQALRVVANNVFLLLVPHFTASALQQILDVIDPSRDDESVLGNESSNGDSAESSGDSESEDEEEGDEEPSESALALKRSLKVALGDAAEDSDDEDEEKEETYLDDAAMERVDESLAQVFRSVKRKKSGLSSEDEALLHFRNRCLEVLGLIVSSRPSIRFVLPSLFTAVSALEFGHGEKHQDSLAASAANCLRRFFAIKKIQLEDSIDADLDFKDVLSQLISRFQTVSDQKLFALLADVCTFVFRCAVHCDGKEAKQRSHVGSCIAVYKDSLKDYIRRSDCHIPERLFSSVITSYTLHGWELADVLLECAFDESIRLFKRTRALTLLTGLTSNHAQVRQFVSEERWTSFSQTSSREIAKSLNKMMSTELKQHSIGKMLQLTYNIACIDESPREEDAERGALLSTVGLLADKGLSKESSKLIGKITRMMTKSLDSGAKRSISSPEKKSKKMKAT